MKRTNKEQDKYIPLAIPDIGREEINNVVRCLKSGWLTTGNLNFEFEGLLEDYLGAKEVICLDSCTSALHLSLAASGIGRGDEVITTPFTFAATANVIVHCGAKPVFCDIDRQTYNIDTEQIRNKITKRTRAIIPVHFAGYPCDLKSIYRIAGKYGITVVEDAAHALGSAIDGKRIGSFPGITCFSFYATKSITTGEGGCVALRDKKLARKIRVLRFHGIDRDAWKRYAKGGRWKYDIVEAGYKNNMTDVLAAIGIAQIKRADSFIKLRQKISARYGSAFKGLAGFQTPAADKDIVHSRHLYPCLIEKNEFGMDRNKFIVSMDRVGVGTSVHYIPLHLHSFYRKKYGYKKGDFPVAEEIGGKIVSIPLYSKMTDTQVDRVITAVKSIKKG